MDDSKKYKGIKQGNHIELCGGQSNPELIALEALALEGFTKEPLVLSKNDQWLKIKDTSIPDQQPQQQGDQSAMKMVAGTARSMGINVTGKFPDSE